MVSIEFSRFLDDYRNSPEVNVDIAHPGKSGTDRYRSNGPRMFINLGSADGFDKGSMLGFILDATDLNKTAVGKIDIKGVYSFIEIEDAAMLETALKAFEGEFYNGRKIRVDKSEPGNNKKSAPPGRERERPEKRGWGEKPSFGNKTDKKSNNTA